jgi:hypothetical protein
MVNQPTLKAFAVLDPTLLYLPWSMSLVYIMHDIIGSTCSYLKVSFYQITFSLNSPNNSKSVPPKLS